MTMVSTSIPLQAGARPTEVPATAARDPRLDFFRGIAMIIILFAHTPGNFFTSWIPARWGFSDATEMFVFCSGMASAVAFGRTFERSGWALGTGRVVYRVWQVYWAHLCLFFSVAMMMAAMDQWGGFGTQYIGSLNLWRFFQDPGPQLVGLFTLTYVPNYFDILPMYLVILAMMPLVIALGRISPWLVAAALLTVWVFAQEALLEHLGVGQLALNFPAEPWSDRQWFFNPFGWQLLFFTGFALMIGWIPAPPVNLWLIAIALIVVLANVPLSNIGVREFGFDWARDWRVENRAWFLKTDFGILRYVHFLALAYLAWAAAGAGGRWLLPRSQAFLPRVWGQVVKIVMRIGQQSLAVFVFSMALARLNGFWLDQWGRDAAWHTVVVNLVGVGLIIIVAYFVGWVKSQPWRPKKASA